MKKLFVICFASLFLLAACGANPIEEDLLSYINDGIVPLASEEEDIMSEYESVTGENYSDDETLYVAIEDSIIPKYSNFIDKIEAVVPGTKEVRDLHEEYIKGSNMQYNAMVKILSAIEDNDYNRVTEANEMLAEGRAIMRQYTNNLEALAKENDVVFE